MDRFVNTDPRTAAEDLRFSVVIPTYNGFERLKTTIRSVLDQTFPAVEIIVIDDGSTDRTPGIAQVFPGRIRYERTANGGQQRARNHGVGLSTGNWIALLDHDDVWEPETFRRSMRWRPPIRLT